MYVTTFYSFKGGVGRTMALVNAAVTLALRGRRVLVVDFDVEAPGLDTFDVLRTREEVPGVIDFVTHYLESGQAPDVTDYVDACPEIGEAGGQLWIMPSGKSDSYASNFNQVDWGELYDRRDGYLLFEDLKEQWNHVLRPDYVLIDSRTGHTDTCGICTRQLPNSVVVFFFPNEQNLRGLEEVVRDIRSEADGPRNKTIELHFVMSNVPDLDDEDQILENQVHAFGKQLGFRRKPMIVHRYDSLSLLNQDVFAKERPRSRLAKEYRAIVQEISARNWEDRYGALEYIRRAARGRRKIQEDSVDARERMLDRIKNEHFQDGEVLFRLAELWEDDGQSEYAASLTQQAIDAGYEQPEAYLKRAQVRYDGDDLAGASEDAWRVLKSADVVPPLVREAVAHVLRVDSSVSNEILESIDARSFDIDDRFWLASSFELVPEHLPIMVSLWEQILRVCDLSSNMITPARHYLGLSYMALGRCLDASRLFRRADQNVHDLSIDNAFNYGMAMWGVNGMVESLTFQHVVDLNRSNPPKTPGTNYLQCMAIANWASGDVEAAIDLVGQVQATLSVLRGRTELSCWRYFQASARDFEEDLEEIRALIDHGHAPMPRFVSDRATDSSQSPQDEQQP